MSQEAISQSIEALHAEIEKLNTPDAAVKAKLLALIEGLESQLNEPDNVVHQEANKQQLAPLIEQFEADHPQVTATLGRLLDTLSSLGI